MAFWVNAMAYHLLLKFVYSACLPSFKCSDDRGLLRYESFHQCVLPFVEQGLHFKHFLGVSLLNVTKVGKGWSL